MANCNCRCNCIGASIVVSIIIGIIAAVLRFTAIITLTPAFLWVVLGVALVFLAILLITAARSSSESVHDCVCAILTVLLVGIVGAILTSVILLGIAYVSGVIGAIITGLLFAFFSLIIISVACLVLCKFRCRICDRA